VVKQFLSDKRLMRRLRTSLLAVVATCALFWGAIDIVGVPAGNMLWLIAESVLVVGVIIFVAAFAGWLLHWWRDNSSN
jgi:hypothetical protein